MSQPVPGRAHRRLPLEHPVNFRDLGGYPAGPGRQTAWNRLYRADTLHGLSAADIEALRALGLRAACDLRSRGEVARHPSAFHGGEHVAYHHIAARLPPSDDPLATTLDNSRHAYVYRYILDHGAPMFQGLFVRLGDPESYPLVFHCTAGKDRTGIVAAVLLLTAGVDRETVYADYLETMTYADQLHRRLWSLFGEGEFDPERYPIQVHPEAIEAVIERLDRHYGSARAYLDAMGVPAAHVDTFLAQFVVPAPAEE